MMLRQKFSVDYLVRWYTEEQLTEAFSFVPAWVQSIWRVASRSSTPVIQPPSQSCRLQGTIRSLARPGWCNPSRRHLTGLLGRDVTGAELGEERRQPVLCFSGCLWVQPGQALLQQVILGTRDRWMSLVCSARQRASDLMIVVVVSRRGNERKALTRTWQARSFSHLRPSLISLTVT